MAEQVKVEPYLKTSLLRDRLPEFMLDLLGALHWGERDNESARQPKKKTSAAGERS